MLCKRYVRYYKNFMKKDYCFWTVCSSQYRRYFDLMNRSFKKFHPNDELIVFGDEDIQEAANNGFPSGTWFPYFADKLIKEYKTIIHLDVDIIITDNLYELLELDYDIAAAQNNCGWYHSVTGSIPEHKYMNAGFHAIKSERFVTLWKEMSKMYWSYNNLVEQDLMNQCAFYGGFNVLVLDEDINNPFWGVSILDRWEQIIVKDDRLWCQGRKVKMLHWAGGNIEKINYRDHNFSGEVKSWLDKI